jgi:dienelactone hydrolase
MLGIPQNFARRIDMSEMIELGTVKGYLAKPTAAGPFPAMIVIQEWWGLDAQTKSIADRFAKEGYLAFAPDLYHGELAQLGDGDTAMKLMGKYGLMHTMNWLLCLMPSNLTLIATEKLAA